MRSRTGQKGWTACRDNEITHQATYDKPTVATVSKTDRCIKVAVLQINQSTIRMELYLNLWVGRMAAGISPSATNSLLGKLQDAHGDIPLVWFLADGFAVAVPPSAEQERRAAAALVLNELRANLGDIWASTLLADAHAALTLPVVGARSQRAEVREILLGAIAKMPGSAARRAGATPAEQHQTLAHNFFASCGSNECARLFAAAVLDAAVGRPFDERAASLIELLKCLP
jgi:hypothetical protein